MNKKIVALGLVCSLMSGTCSANAEAVNRGILNGSETFKVSNEMIGRLETVKADTINAVEAKADVETAEIVEVVQTNDSVTANGIIEDVVSVEDSLVLSGVLKNHEIYHEVEETEEMKKNAKAAPTIEENRYDGDGDVDWTGYFSCTAYCNCVKCCGKYSPEAGGKGTTKSGTMPKQGRTIAVDPNVIPLGTKVVINGNVYTAEDTGGAVKGNIIDIYFASHSATSKFGRRTLKVKVLKK